jgi:2,4-dienoyl-CoA reductase-like NADH-dependent reductase (Old Yellow Enzyme family)
VSEQAGRDRYPHVFEPFKLGPVEVSNRVFMGPHGIMLEAPTPGHEAYNVPSVEVPHYFAERVAGGVGLILHSTLVSPLARQINLKATPWFAESVPSYAAVADAVHEHGGKVMAELWYVGFLPHTWEVLGPEAPILMPSATAQYYAPTAWRSATRSDLQRMVADYAQSARHLRQAGYDGVELHVSHSSILECFLSPSFNRRTDEYGGSLENRARLLMEVIEATRAEFEGADMALGIRFTADELLDNGYDAEGAREILAYLDASGTLDFVDFDISVEPEQQNLMTTNFFEPKFHNLHRVNAIADSAGSMAKIAVPGRVTRVAEMEDILAESVLDMVGAVRGLIAEPNLVRNALEGDEERSRTCIASNHCLESAGQGGFGCGINAEAGKEERWGTRTHGKASRTMKLLVVGAGPAGLEAARVAAHRGHDVTLVERRDDIGGNLARWAKLPAREHLATLVDWHRRRLDKLGVTIETGVDITIDGVLERSPEAVILATGSIYSADGDSGFTRMPIAGADPSFVYTPEQVIDGEVTFSGDVVVVDDEGLQAGVGVAEIAAAQGAKVTLIARKGAPAAHQMFHLPNIVPRLLAAGVTIMPGIYIRKVAPGAATLYPTIGGPEWDVPADSVIVATSRKPVVDLEPLTEQLPYVYVVGDALAPRTLREATYEGYRFARRLGDDDMSTTTVEELFHEMAPLRPAQYVKEEVAV